MWNLGFQKILVDPTVQVFYRFSDQHIRRSISDEALFDNRTGYIPDPKLAGSTHDRVCCPLSDPGAQYIDWDRCHPQQFKADAKVPYSADDLKEWEVHWFTT
mmetsp:Transcript_1390/g.3176  ORF Transcript_1390/g.3176 Transcript_1390/m.3176 type:complete len:102 (+) Transcript_1390:81-386(+)